MRPLAWICAASIAAVLAAGCGTPLKERFYTLAPPPAASPAPSPASASFSVVVGPLTIPETVDRPQLVLRVAPNRVLIVEEARWAAPLKSEISRVIAAELAQLLEGAQTSTAAQRATPNADYRVFIDIQRFDSAPGDGVAIEAQWSLRTGDNVRQTGRSAVREAAGTSYEDIVAAHGRALAAVSRDIAAAIRANPLPAR
jgi:uncharacterized lipoprotein YmbA